MSTRNNPDATYGVKRLDMNCKTPPAPTRRGSSQALDARSAQEALAITIQALKRAGCYNTAACLQANLDRQIRR